MFTRKTGRRIAIIVVAGMLFSTLLASVASFHASGSPDGLERVAEDTGFMASAEDSPFADSPVADYAFAGTDHERLSVATAGFVGVAITACVAFGLFALLRPREKRSELQ